MINESPNNTAKSGDQRITKQYREIKQSTKYPFFRSRSGIYAPTKLYISVNRGILLARKLMTPQYFA